MDHTRRMDRILEPEIMDGVAEVRAYAAADFSDSNQWYVNHLIAEFPSKLASIVDLGCGPADVPVRIARAIHDAHITAVDGSGEMLKIARAAIAAARLEARVQVHQGLLPGLALPDQTFDAVLCKDMLHHLHDPQVLWNEARRLARPGAAIYVMDLLRPNTPEEARAIVERVSANEHPILKEDFYNSLCAAFTVDEVREQLRVAGLPLEVEQVTDRHMRVKGLMH
jgi:ubiquinone/menaquinone biosynthesis C-methylase UbiE